METVIAMQMAKYLQTLGEGTIGTNIFVDYMPDQPHEALVIYDNGGNPTESTQLPEAWRELYIQVRAVKHPDGYERIWRVLKALLYPTEGFITVDGEQYTAQLQEIPSVYQRDGTNRYLFGFVVIVQKILAVNDEWLNALANWTSSVLAGWNVYQAYPGNKRPCVIWQFSGMQVQEVAATMFQVSKRFTAQVLGNTANDQILGATQLVQELGSVIKLPIAPGKYAIVQGPLSDIKANDVTGGQVAVTLTRKTKRPLNEAPLMSNVHPNGVIHEGVIQWKTT
jgi:hypothetical protein